MDPIREVLRAGALRTLKKREGLIDLTSNDYLGLSRDPSFQKEVVEKWNLWSESISQKTGSTGSRLLTGNHRYFEETEEKIATFHGFESATLFNCGYMANLAILSSIPSSQDTLIADISIHASIHDGMKLSKASNVYFRHNDLDHLEMRLKNRKGKIFVIVESLYSMEGVPTPLQAIANLCQRYGAQLIVDEAHAIGVLGEQGEGYVAALGLQNQVFACMVGFGKALGAHGAVLLGSHLLKQRLLNFARPLIYTIALPLPLLAAIRCSYDRFPQMKKERRHLHQLCKQFYFSSHIHPLLIRGNAQAKLASLYLSSKGFDVRPILSPTVPKGKEILRLIVHAHNSQVEIASCLSAIEKWRSK